MTNDFSYGIVPIFNKIVGVDEPYFLLVEQYGDFWSFPKGHPESSESEIEAATREFYEETGIHDLKIIHSVNFIEQYNFTDKGEQINKTVKFFPAFTSKFFCHIDQKEITNWKWLPYKEAITKLKFKETKELLEKTYEWLQKDGREIYESTERPPKKAQAVSLKALINKDSKYLALKDLNGNWELPGGKIEYGENIIESLKREVLEETGITQIDIKRTPIDILDILVDYKLIKYQFILIVFEAVINQQGITLSHEHTEYGFFDAKELLELKMKPEWNESIKRIFKL